MSKKSNTITDEKIEYVLDHLDWERIRQVMDLLDWKYGVGSKAYRPTFSTLRQTAKGMLLELKGYEPGSKIRSGGFVAESDENGEMTVGFELCRSDSSDAS